MNFTKCSLFFLLLFSQTLKPSFSEYTLKALYKIVQAYSFLSANGHSMLNTGASIGSLLYLNDRTISMLENMPEDIQDWCNKIIKKHNIALPLVEFKVIDFSPSAWFVLKGLKKTAIVIRQDVLKYLRKFLGENPNLDVLRDRFLAKQEESLLHESNHILSHDMIRRCVYNIAIGLTLCTSFGVLNKSLLKICKGSDKTFVGLIKAAVILILSSKVQQLLYKLSANKIERYTELKADRFAISKLNLNQISLLIEHEKELIKRFLEFVENPEPTLSKGNCGDLSKFLSFREFLRQQYFKSKSNVKFSEWLKPNEIEKLEYLFDEGHPSSTDIMNELNSRKEYLQLAL